MQLVPIAKRLIAIVLLLFILGFYLLYPALSTSNGDGGISPFKNENNKGSDWKKTTKLWKVLCEGGDDFYQIPKYDCYSIISSPTILANIEKPTKTLYIATSVENNYKASDIDVLKRYYNAGGKLLIADDFGYADTFSREFNVDYFAHQMYDEKFHNNVSLPLIDTTWTPVKGTNLTDYKLVFNAPTGLWTPPNAKNTEIIAQGSNKSYVDRNDDGRISIDDVKGPIPMVVKYQEAGKGTIFFFADAGIFTDEAINWGGKSINAPDAGTGSSNVTTKDPTNNMAFIIAVIKTMLPTGGKIMFDESRHQQDKYVDPIYNSIETITIMTSNELEIVLLLVGMIMMLSIVVYKAKDKEDWVHIFDLSRIKRRADLPDSKRLIRDRLRRALCGKVRLNLGLSNEEFEAMNQTQVTSIIKDHDLNDLLYNDAREYTSEELRSLSDKIRRWEK